MKPKTTKKAPRANVPKRVDVRIRMSENCARMILPKERNLKTWLLIQVARRPRQSHRKLPVLINHTKHTK